MLQVASIAAAFVGICLGSVYGWMLYEVCRPGKGQRLVTVGKGSEFQIALDTATFDLVSTCPQVRMGFFVAIGCLAVASILLLSYRYASRLSVRSELSAEGKL